MAEEKLIKVRDEYYRRPDGTIRHRRLINGKVVWDDNANVLFLDCLWPWDQMGVAPLVKQGDMSIVLYKKP